MVVTGGVTFKSSNFQGSMDHKSNNSTASFKSVSNVSKNYQEDTGS